MQKNLICKLTRRTVDHSFSTNFQASAAVTLCGMVHFRQTEALQLQLTQANEKVSQLQERMEQSARKAEEEQQEMQTKHQAELKKMQDKFGNLVRSMIGERFSKSPGKPFPQIS